MDLLNFLTTYLIGVFEYQKNLIIHNLTDITNPGYGWLFALILIKLYRKYYLKN